MKYLELNLNKPTATREGVKDHVVLEEIRNGMFVERRGNIGIKVGRNKERVSAPKPMSDWDKTVDGLTGRGYIIVPGKTKPSKRKKVDYYSGGFAPEPDKDAQELIKILTTLSRKAVEEAFSGQMSIDQLTPEQIRAGQLLLDGIADRYQQMSREEFNTCFCQYYSIIPRRMKALGDGLASGKDSYGRRLSEAAAMEERVMLIAKEQEYFKNLLALLEDRTKTADARMTACQTYNLSVRKVSSEEEEMIRKKMGGMAGSYRRAWRTRNFRTEKAFDDFCIRESLTEGKGIDHLFHGSRGENFWSIFKGGLTINPKDVVITGKAYGRGTYFAPDAHKSANYTDRFGSKWAHGTAPVGYMGIYKVATGKRYNGSKGCDTSLNWDKLQKICPGAHCTWAEHRYSGFMMDEVIVYQDCQSTIEYLIEISA